MGDSWITWRTKMWGTVHGVNDQERGDYQNVPDEHARQYVTQGLADFGEVPLGRLRPAYELSAKDVADGQTLTRERREEWVQDNQHLQPKPGTTDWTAPGIPALEGRRLGAILMSDKPDFTIWDEPSGRAYGAEQAERWLVYVLSDPERAKEMWEELGNIDFWLLVLAVMAHPCLRDEVWPVLSDKLKFFLTVNPVENEGQAIELVRLVVKDVVAARYVEQEVA